MVEFTESANQKYCSYAKEPNRSAYKETTPRMMFQHEQKDLGKRVRKGSQELIDALAQSQHVKVKYSNGRHCNHLLDRG